MSGNARRIRRQLRMSEGLGKLCDPARITIDPRREMPAASSADRAKSAHRFAQGLPADR